jgi:hypothetical protein
LFNTAQKTGKVADYEALKIEIDHRIFVDKLFATAFPKHFGEDTKEI